MDLGSLISRSATGCLCVMVFSIETYRLLKLQEASMNIVRYDIGVTAPITPSEPLPPIPDIPRGCLVIIGGRAPIWRYGIALHHLHGSAAGAVATFDPRLGAVVVVTHLPTFREGQVIDCSW